MKVIYHVGETISAQTVVKHGVIEEDNGIYLISGKGETYRFDKILSAEVFKFSAGTMVKVINGEDTVYLAVVRIFLPIGTGFAIINYFATKKLSRLLSQSASK